jgi:hypothetical protein
MDCFQVLGFQFQLAPLQLGKISKFSPRYVVSGTFHGDVHAAVSHLRDVLSHMYEVGGDGIFLWNCPQFLCDLPDFVPKIPRNSSKTLP